VGSRQQAAGNRQRAAGSGQQADRLQGSEESRARQDEAGEVRYSTGTRATTHQLDGCRIQRLNSFVAAARCFPLCFFLFWVFRVEEEEGKTRPYG